MTHVSLDQLGKTLVRTRQDTWFLAVPDNGKDGNNDNGNEEDNANENGNDSILTVPTICYQAERDLREAFLRMKYTQELMTMMVRGM